MGDGGEAQQTNIQNISTATRIQTEGSIARWAVLRLKLADVLVKACFVGHVATGELENALAAQGMFEGFFTDGAFGTDKGPLAPGARAVDLHCRGRVSAGSRIEGHAGAVGMSGRPGRVRLSGVDGVGDGGGSSWTSRLSDAGANALGAV